MPKHDLITCLRVKLLNQNEKQKMYGKKNTKNINK